MCVPHAKPRLLEYLATCTGVVTTSELENPRPAVSTLQSGFRCRVQPVFAHTKLALCVRTPLGLFPASAPDHCPLNRKTADHHTPRPQGGFNQSHRRLVEDLPTHIRACSRLQDRGPQRVLMSLDSRADRGLMPMDTKGEPILPMIARPCCACESSRGEASFLRFLG